MQLLEQVRNQVEVVLSSHTPNHVEHAKRVSPTRDQTLGDYQANVVFALAKELGVKPDDLAQTLADQLKESAMFETVEVAGKGFINMRLSQAVLREALVTAASDGRCGVSTSDSPKTYVIDFSSPNVAKPMHVGHIRSTVIGDSIARSLRFYGHEVITDNHLGDWGTQFGMIIYGYKHFVDNPGFDLDPVRELSRLYRLVQQIISYQSALVNLPNLQVQVAASEKTAQEAETSSLAKPADKSLEKAARAAKRRHEALLEELSGLQSKIDSVSQNQALLQMSQQHPNIEQSALKETALMHAGDEHNLELWRRFMPPCLESIQRIYDLLNVEFNHQLGESFYHDRLAAVVEGLKSKGLAKISEGAMCVFLDGFDAPMIVQKQDGAFLYATTDLATVQYRVETFDPDVILYVVDFRQGEHFQKFFAASKAMDYDIELRHISFGTVMGQNGKPYKTREGDVFGLESLLFEAIAKAKSVVCDEDRLTKASLQMDSLEQDSVATTVGLGAIKYADLSHNRTSDYIFDLNKMIQLEGNTATYIQYSYARAASILRKIEAEKGIATDDVPSVDSIAIEHLAERTLSLQLLRFEDAIRTSLDDFQPSILADYLFETAKLFASFFDQCPVLRAETETAAATRRLLVNLSRQVLKQGLELLGIGVVERM
jgi:arginyl-tRNA synthetase